MCNCDEAEPGTFKDPQLLEETPHQIIEGIADRVVRDRLPPRLHLYSRRVQARLRDLSRSGRAGARRRLPRQGDLRIELRSRDHDPPRRGRVHLRRRDRAAQLARRPARRAASQAAVSGDQRALREPTVVNNVETLAYLPYILKNGPEWFKAVGTERSTGYKVVSISGHVKKPGNYEIPLGTTIRELIETRGRDARRPQVHGGSTRRRLVGVPVRRTPRSSVRLRVARQGGDDARLRARWSSSTNRPISSRPRTRSSASSRTSRAVSARPAAKAATGSKKTLERFARRATASTRDIDILKTASHQITGHQPVPARRFDRTVPGLGRQPFRRPVPRAHSSTARRSRRDRRNDVVTVTIDGVDVTVPEGHAARRGGEADRSTRSRSTATIPSSGRRDCAASVWSRSRGCRSCRSRATRRSRTAWSCTR